jgi:hypothetical protein
VPISRLSFPSADPRRILEGNYVADKSSSKFTLMRIEGYR